MKKLLLLSAAVSAVLAGQVQAAAVMPLTAAGTPDFAQIATLGGYAETFIAGSSAATPFMEEAMRADCSGTIYKYSFSGSLAYVCSKADLIPGLAAVAQPFLVMHKRDGGGSINGIKAAQGTLQSFIDVATLSNATSCGTAALNVSTCIGGTLALQAPRASEVNFADVDPTQFESALNGAVAGASAVASKAVATQVFGVVVNTRLRDALQTAQIVDPDGAGPLTAPLAGCAVGSESEACMPSLTSSQIATIFGNNRMTDWSKLRNGTTTSLQNLFSANVAANQPGNRDIHICTRTAGSGTLATFNIKFHDAPCNGGLDEAIVTASTQTITPETGANGGVKIVHSMSGSGDVENCLEGLNTGATTSTFTYPATIPAVDAKPWRWAIGIMGVERNSLGSAVAGSTLAAAPAKAYRFIKIDGNSPSAQNVVSGKYKFWAELVAVGAATVDPLAIELTNNMSNPTKIGNLNVVQSWNGVTGFLGIANNADATLLPTFNTAINGLMGSAFDTLRPVNPYTHATATGGGLNHCRVPTVMGGASRVVPIY